MDGPKCEYCAAKDLSCNGGGSGLACVVCRVGHKKCSLVHTVSEASAVYLESIDKSLKTLAAIAVAKWGNPEVGGVPNVGDSVTETAGETVEGMPELEIAPVRQEEGDDVEKEV